MDAASRFQAWLRGAPPTTYARYLDAGTENSAVVLPAAYSALFSPPFQRVQAASSPKADALFEQQAKGLGLTPAQLASAINEWAKSPEHGYDKGLAALYRGRYAEAASLLSKSIPSPPGKLLFRYVPAARAEYELGNYKAAESALRQVAAVYREDPIVLNDLAVVLSREAKYSEAKPMFERAIEIAQSTLGPQSPDGANTLNNLAEVYRYQGDFAEAEKRYQRALVIFGPASPVLARVINNIAALYDDEGKPEKAESLYRDALNMDKDELPPDHPDIARDLNNLGLFYRTYGGKAKYVEAENFLKQA
jgi:tetratricopeptide (TPR) repeat protein